MLVINWFATAGNNIKGPPPGVMEYWSDSIADLGMRIVDFLYGFDLIVIANIQNP